MEKFSRLKPLTKNLFIGSVLVSSAAMAFADDAQTVEDLKARVAQLEGIAQKEGILPSSQPAPKLVSAMSDISISGFVTASYFYDTSTPSDRSPNAYLWNRHSGDFSLNKAKVVFASKPVEAGSEWDAAFRLSLIWGEDAPIVNTGNYSTTGSSITGVQQGPGGAVTNISTSPFTAKSASSSGFEALREAYVELNIPIGSGLNVRAGQLISLLNWESGDGGSANPNFSQGNQWFYTGNGPSAGIQLGYNFTDKVGIKVRVQNGLYAGPLDSNEAKTFIGSLSFKPTDKLWFNLIGFAGQESKSLYVSGGSIIGGYQFTPKFGSGYEFDVFDFDPSGLKEDVFWSMGGWFWYDFTPKVTLALRAEYLDDDTGFGTGGLLGFSSNNGGSIYGVTLTLDWKPLPNIKIQPEIRFDGTDVKNGFDGVEDRVIIGAGISYIF